MRVHSCRWNRPHQERTPHRTCHNVRDPRSSPRRFFRILRASPDTSTSTRRPRCRPDPYHSKYRRRRSCAGPQQGRCIFRSTSSGRPGKRRHKHPPSTLRTHHRSGHILRSGNSRGRVGRSSGRKLRTQLGKSLRRNHAHTPARQGTAYHTGSGSGCCRNRPRGGKRCCRNQPPACSHERAGSPPSHPAFAVTPSKPTTQHFTHVFM